MRQWWIKGSKELKSFLGWPTSTCFVLADITQLCHIVHASFFTYGICHTYHCLHCQLSCMTVYMFHANVKLIIANSNHVWLLTFISMQIWSLPTITYDCWHSWKCKFDNCKLYHVWLLTFIPMWIWSLWTLSCMTVDIIHTTLFIASLRVPATIIHARAFCSLSTLSCMIVDIIHTTLFIDSFILCDCYHHSYHFVHCQLRPLRLLTSFIPLCSLPASSCVTANIIHTTFFISHCCHCATACLCPLAIRN